MNSLHEEQLLREAREADRQRREIQELSDFKSVIDTVEGRRFIRRVLAECGIHQTSFTGDALTMSFKEGRRSVGLWLQSLFFDCPDQYIKLLKEESNVSDSH